MNLKVIRDVRGDSFTLSRVLVDSLGDGDWKEFAFCVEDKDRMLAASMPLSEIKALKVKGETCLPTGTYAMGWHTRPTGLIVPMLLDTPGFKLCLWHSGNTALDTEGCLCPGMERDIEKGSVSRSKVACDWLYANLRQHGLGTTTIERSYP